MLIIEKQIFPSCKRLTVVSDFGRWENMLCFVRVWVGRLLAYRGEEERAEER